MISGITLKVTESMLNEINYNGYYRKRIEFQESDYKEILILLKHQLSFRLQEISGGNT